MCIVINESAEHQMGDEKKKRVISHGDMMVCNGEIGGACGA